MSTQIAIMGAGQDKAAITEALVKQGHTDIIVLTPDEAKAYMDNPLKRATDVYKIESPPIFKYLEDSREFVCKGKHQYRNVNGEWVCQCGRKTTD